jgi:hypothetical protein
MVATTWASVPSAAGYEVEHLATRSLEAHVERRMRSMQRF